MYSSPTQSGSSVRSESSLLYLYLESSHGQKPCKSDLGNAEDLVEIVPDSHGDVADIVVTRYPDGVH